MIDQTKLRIVTAASLFDGHDAAINIMRRIMQAKGAEVIHLGHNRSAWDIVKTAIEEDVQAIAITSYQGGHVEFFKYLKDLLKSFHCGHIKLFGGGGGTILPDEIEELQRYGIEKIYTPEDGAKMGLEGMIDDLLVRIQSPDEYWNASSDWENTPETWTKDIRKIARAITLAEYGLEYNNIYGEERNIKRETEKIPIVGITGTGGAGKSSLTDEIVRRFLNYTPENTVAIISIDPSRKRTGGALLGDRIRMNSINTPRVYMRSLATRDSETVVSIHLKEILEIISEAGYDLIIIESAGAGQGDVSLVGYCDVLLYVMTPEYGAASQLEKINMLDYADLVSLNKSDKAGALDALNDVRKQYRRNHNLWNAKDDTIPVIGTNAAQFNDPGVNSLFEKLLQVIEQKTGRKLEAASYPITQNFIPADSVVPSARVNYLSEIADTVRKYNSMADQQCQLASDLYRIKGALEILK